MTQKKSIRVNRTLACNCCLIISVSVLYNIYSLYNFFVRTKILMMNTSVKCEIRRINESRLIYGLITLLIVITQILISFYICKNSIRYV